MTREYKVRTSNIITGIILEAFVIVIIIVSYACKFISPPEALWFGVGSFCFGLFGLFNTIKSSLIMDDSNITIMIGPSSKSMKISEVKGYKAVNTKKSTYLELQSNEGQKKPLRIWYKTYQQSDEIFKVITSKFPDLDPTA